MLVASKTVLYFLRLEESNRIGFSIVQPEVRFGQNDVPPNPILKLILNKLNSKYLFYFILNLIINKY
jgi:hypothetical protein